MALKVMYANEDMVLKRGDKVGLNESTEVIYKLPPNEIKERLEQIGVAARGGPDCYRRLARLELAVAELLKISAGELEMRWPNP